MDILDFRLRPLREFISEEAYQEVCARANRVAFEDGEAVQMRGDESVRLCIVSSGAVRVGRFQHDGAFTMVLMVGAGAHFGEVGMQRTSQTFDVHAVGPVEIDVINAALLDHLLQHSPSFALGLWRCNTARLNALLELYEDVRTLSVPQRLGKVLYLHTGHGELEDGVACLQRDLAALLGMTPVSIGTALKELQGLDLIETGYRCVKVPDKRRLGKWLRKTGAA